MMEDLRSNVFDPIRRVCESQQFQFLIVLQNSSFPDQRYWTSSQQLNHFLGDWIAEIATRIEAGEDTKVENLDVDLNVGVFECPPSPAEPANEEEELIGHWISEIASHVPDVELAPTEVESTLPSLVLEKAGTPSSTSVTPIEPSSTTKGTKGRIGGKRLNADDDVSQEHSYSSRKRHRPEGDREAGVQNTNDRVFLMPDGEEDEEVEGEEEVVVDAEEEEEVEAEENALNHVPETVDEKVPEPVEGRLNEPFSWSTGLVGKLRKVRRVKGCWEENDKAIVNVPEKRPFHVDNESITHPVERSIDVVVSRRVGDSNFQCLREQKWDQARPLREDDPAVQYLDDDLETDSFSGTHSHGQSDPSPIIWKKHFFDKPLRPSLVKRLLEDKIVYNSRTVRYHVTDAQYADLCWKILRKRNPYCVFQPKSLCRFRKEKDWFQADFVCRYRSCQVGAFVFITCGDNAVSMEFLEKKSELKKKWSARSVGRDSRENPFITFTSHEDDDFSTMERPKTVRKRNQLKGALTANQINDGFVSKLAFDENLNKWVVSSQEYLGFLQPLLAQWNPYCHFEKVLTPCFTLANPKKYKSKSIPHRFKVHLACSKSNCRVVVSVYVSNPSGNVILQFASKTGVLDPAGVENHEDFITLDHRGSLVFHAGDFQVVNPTAENEGSHGKLSNGEKGTDESNLSPLCSSADTPAGSTTYFLKISSPIVHDEKISQSVLKEGFLDKLIKGETPEGKVIKRPNLADASYIPILRPIIKKYNPNCSVFGAHNRHVFKTREVKCVFQCRRKDCDFLVECKVHLDTGEVVLYLRNRFTLSCDPYAPSFCYIRHEKDLSQQIFRKREREMLYKMPLDALRQMFDKNPKVRRNIIRDALKWRQQQAELGQPGHEGHQNQGADERTAKFGEDDLGHAHNPAHLANSDHER